MRDLFYKKNLMIAGVCGLLVSCGGDQKKEDLFIPKDPQGDFFQNEVKPASTLPCFAGAYYRKIVSSKDCWLGIGGRVHLPEITFDVEREHPSKPGQYLDNPSVYMGGNSNGQETDIGLTWEVIRLPDGTVSLDRRAFRPFLRRTAYSPTGQTSHYMNAPAEEAYYWYQGDEVSMSLELVKDGILRFTVAGSGKKFEYDYSCDGYRFGSAIEFKRVNAIDQVANEGKPAQDTRTKVEKSEWRDTWLLRKIEGVLVKAPMHTGRFTDMRCPDKKFFTVHTSDSGQLQGAESIDIDGDN